jgi:hypothetical protein
VRSRAKIRDNVPGRTIDESDTRARIVKYESLVGYLNDCDPSAETWGSGQGWDGGVNPKEAMRRGRDGDPSLVREYEGHIQDLTATMRGETGPAWVLDVMGSTPCSPAVVAGHPMAMRRRVKRTAPARTARIYVSLICSAGIRASDMIKRGASILALAESLQAANVHVEVNLVAELPCSPRDTIVVVPVETPLDLSVSGFAIAHPAFTRYVTYYLNGNQWGFNGGWPSYMGHTDEERKIGAKILKLDPGDVWVPSASLLDDSVQNPEAWIKRNVMQVMGDDALAS